jgi:hypothetical protein
MDREITVTLTPQLVRWTLIYQFQPLLFIFGFVFLALACNIYLFISRGGHLTPTTGFAYLASLFIPLFLCRRLYSAYSKSMAQMNQMKSPIMQYRLTDEGLYLRSELGSGKTRWADFRGLRKNPKLWRVIAPSGATISLPVELLDEELKAFLSAKVPSKTKRP